MKKSIKYSMFIMMFCIVVLFCFGVRTEAKEKTGTKIHFISLNGVTDAILLESDGHFGMVDSGEDWDYPNSEQYPLREGITINEGYEQQVIHYLRTVGVKKLDFYIATHSHSDHIGSGDEIMNHFPVDRLYIDRYDDSYMLDSHGKDPQDPYYYPQANENYLWDNQYVYDCLIKAANDNNVKIITDLDLDENAQYRRFQMGQMDISIMNYERERDANGDIIPVQSENDNALVVKVNAYGKNALLTSDIDPKNGDTKKVADQLVEELWNDEGLKEKEAKKIEKKNYDFEYNMSSNYEEYNVFVPDERQIEENIEDESQPNLGKKIQIDLMKMVHHGVDYNNTTYFLTSLNPKTVVITGPQSFFNDRMKQCLSGTKVYSTMTDSAAIVAEFSKSGIDTKYNKIISGTEEIDGETYWFDENGRSITGWKYFDNAWHYYNEKGILETGWQTINGSLYYMNSAGIMLTGWQYIDGMWYYFHWSGPMQTGWQYINNTWYFMNVTGAMQTGWQLVGGNWFYMDGLGAMQTGWQYIGDNWYYMDGSGAMKTGWQYIGGNWYYMDSSGVMKTGWQYIGGNWYYMDGSGAMKTGWQYLSNTWYYCENSGRMVSDSWYWVGNYCYYFKDSGRMAANTWIGDWYVDGSGAWIPGMTKPKNEWIYQSGRWWYRHADGSYTRDGWERIGNTQYYFDGSGWMITGWKYSEGIWYYMNDSGAMISNCWYWIGTNCYYFNENGEMAADAWIGDWYVDGSGAWIPEKVYNK